MCDYCDKQETVEHINVKCSQYQQEKLLLKKKLEKDRIKFELQEIFTQSYLYC